MFKIWNQREIQRMCSFFTETQTKLESAHSHFNIPRNCLVQKGGTVIVLYINCMHSSMVFHLLF